MFELSPVIITLGFWFLAAIATEAVVEIITTSKLFEPFVGWVVSKVVPKVGEEPTKHVPWYWWLVHAWVTCGYCFSVPVALLMALLVPGFGFMIFPIKLFVIHRLSNTWHVLYIRAQRGRVRTIDLELKITSGEQVDRE